MSVRRNIETKTNRSNDKCEVTQTPKLLQVPSEMGAKRDSIFHRENQIVSSHRNSGIPFVRTISSFIVKQKFVCHEKEHWSSSNEFLIFSLCLVNGLSHIWRYPTLLFDHGGLSFYGPFTVIHFLLGFPMTLAHFIIGQYSGKGFIGVWNLNPLMVGIGVVFVFQTIIMATVNCVWATRSLHYMVNSFQTELPWSICQKSWTKDRCYHPLTHKSMPLCGNNTEVGALCKCTGVKSLDFNSSNICYTDILDYEQLLRRSYSFYCKGLLACTNRTIAPSFYYFYQTILGTHTPSHTPSLTPSHTPSVYQTFNITLVVTNIVIWFALFVTLGFGVYYRKHVPCVMAFIPYVSGYILIVISFTVDGYDKGLYEFFKFTDRKIYNPESWAAACYYVMYSSCLTDGSIITLSSFNKFNSNIYRNAIIVTLISYFHSISAFFNFGMLIGNMAHRQNKEVKELMVINNTYPSNIIIVYSEVLSYQEYANFWNVLFFTTCFFCLFNNIHWSLESCRLSVFECFIWLRPHKLKLCLISCVWLCCLSVPFFSNHSQKYVNYMECIIGDIGIIVVYLNIIVLVWYYGDNTMMRNLSDMIGYRPWLMFWWRFCWLYTCPLIVGCSALVYIFKDPKTFFTSHRVLPICLCLTPILMVMHIRVRDSEGASYIMRLVNATKPTKWQPQSSQKEEVRRKGVALKNFYRRISTAYDDRLDHPGDS